MARNQNDVFLIGATQVVVGLSATVAVDLSKIPYVVGGSVKLLTGATLALVAGASNISTSGYLLGATEVYPFVGAPKFYLAAGTTATACLALHYSQGISLAPTF